MIMMMMSNFGSKNYNFVSIKMRLVGYIIVVILLKIAFGPQTNVLASEDEKISQLESDKLPRSFSNHLLPKIMQRDKTPNLCPAEHLGDIELINDTIPQDPIEMGTKFFVFNRNGSREVEFELVRNCLVNKLTECLTTPFDLNKLRDILDFRKRTVVIVGGFLSKALCEWQTKMRNLWLEIEDVNVIIIGWDKGNRWHYGNAVANTKVVARQFVVFMHYIGQINGVDVNSSDIVGNMILVGHSLGAHICGFIGQDFGGKVGRITGLDPAGPYFSDNKDYHRLDRNDAQLVDIIHTNADKGWNFFLGLYKPVGHIDYYANDGKWQPNCKFLNFFECNHTAVVHYYISILEHELWNLRNLGLGKIKDDHRLLAYFSEDYNSFKRGQTLKRHCGQLEDDKLSSPELIGEQIMQCAIPMDFIKPPQEFRKELELNYDVNFEESYESARKYYFFTSPELPYVVDHNILKVKFNSPVNKDLKRNKCSFKIEFKMENGKNTETFIDQYKPIMEDDDKIIMSIPFVSLNREGKYKLSDLDTQDFFVKSREDTQIVEAALSILPRSVKIAVRPGRSGPKSAHSIANMITDHHPDYEWKRASNEPTNHCDLVMESIRIQPFKRLRRLMFGVYTLPASSFVEPRVRFEENEISQIGIMGKTLSQNFKASEGTFYLDTIIVGPSDSEPEQTNQRRVEIDTTQHGTQVGMGRRFMFNLK